MERPVRSPLPHGIPPWVKTGAPFFLTICCATRGRNQLCDANVALTVLETVRFYQSAGEWYCHLLLLMPDHLHAIASFPAGAAMKLFVRKFRIYTGRTTGVAWQRDFFDHRLRNDNERELKAAYIRNNPVRAGLVKVESDWPYVWYASVSSDR